MAYRLRMEAPKTSTEAPAEALGDLEAFGEQKVRLEEETAEKLAKTLHGVPLSTGDKVHFDTDNCFINDLHLQSLPAGKLRAVKAVLRKDANGEKALRLLSLLMKARKPVAIKYDGKLIKKERVFWPILTCGAGEIRDYRVAYLPKFAFPLLYAARTGSPFSQGPTQRGGTISRARLAYGLEQMKQSPRASEMASMIDALEPFLAETAAWNNYSVSFSEAAEGWGGRADEAANLDAEMEPAFSAFIETFAHVEIEYS